MSVKSTKKITSAMKMVASAKLRKAEKLIENMVPYEERLGKIVHNFLTSREPGIPLVFTLDRPVKRLAIIAFASNTSLCGAFNNNVSKKMKEVFVQYNQLGKQDFEIYTFGKKITQAIRKEGYEPVKTFDEIAEKPDFAEISLLADEMVKKFLSGEIDRVKLVYHQYKSKGSQVLTTESLLPVKKVDPNENRSKGNVNYFIEPDRDTLRLELLPKYLHIHLFRALLDSNASEHAARMLAMQTATDNADDLLEELTLDYNKTRQQAITAELLDIIGGTLR
jgi:F-type H+-transporting ATPase subunit gamma